MVGIIPSLFYEWSMYPYEEIHKQVSNEINRYGFYEVDLLTELKKHPVEELRLANHHTSLYANWIITVTLQSYLEEKKLI